MKLVNIGCGSVYHSAWINLDVAPVDRAVVRLDARRPLPFSEGEVDAVYHSHLLEHLHADEARAFLRECRRILKPGGVLRVVVPDLEGIARAYLCELDKVREGSDSTLYDWTVLELVDQLTRERPGGEMLAFVRQISLDQKSRLRPRAGEAVLGLRDTNDLGRRVTFRWAWRRLRLVTGAACLLALGGRSWVNAFRSGIFRQGGEVHRRMYDDHSLRRLLVESGYAYPKRLTAMDSAISGFATYGLDAVDGRVRKPDSLFMEAIKPLCAGKAT